jgi:hypothetical protein
MYDGFLGLGVTDWRFNSADLAQILDTSTRASDATGIESAV